MPTLPRRAVLAAAGTAVTAGVAGCADRFGGRDAPRTDGPPPESADRLPAAQLRLLPVDDTGVGRWTTRPPGRASTAGRLVLQRAVADGTTTVDAEPPPLRGDDPWVYDGRVYRLSREITAERPATRYFWDFEPTEGGGGDATVRFEDLPALDREQFRLEGLADGAAGERTPLDVGATFVYANESRDRSALVPTPDRPIVVWGPDRRARFTVRDSTAKNATLYTYEYTAQQVASSVAAYGTDVRERYAFAFPDLSDAERDIVDAARGEDAYAVEQGEPVPDAFYSLAEKLAGHDPVYDRRDGATGEYLATYESQLYRVDLIDGRDFDRGPTATTTG